MTCDAKINEKLETMRVLQDALEKASCDYDWFEGYAESENEDETPRGIAVANWNDATAERVGKVLEHLGVPTEWCDEWTRCDQCNKAVRTQPTCYGWLPRYSWIGECGITCESCIKEDVDGSGYLEELVNNVRKADTLGIDWSAYGFVRPDCDRYETGFHIGQNDTPEKVRAALIDDLGKEFDCLFQITSACQFNINWIAWVRHVDWEDED